MVRIKKYKIPLIIIVLVSITVILFNRAEFRNNILNDIESIVLSKNNMNDDLKKDVRNKIKNDKTPLATKYFLQAYLEIDKKVESDKVNDYLKKAEKNINKNTPEIVKIYTYKFLSDYMVQKNNIEKAIEYSNKAFCSIHPNNYDKRYKSIPYIFKQIVPHDDAREIVIKNITHALDSKILSKEARIFLNRFLSATYILDYNYSDAISTNLEIIKLTKEIGDTYYLHKSMIDMSIISKNLDGYKTAKEILNKIDTSDIKDKTKRADVEIYKSINLSQIEITLGNYNKAKEYLDNVDKYIKYIPNEKSNSIQCVQNITRADMFLKKGDVKNAEYYINKEVNNFEEASSYYSDVDIYYYIILGNIYRVKSDYDNAARQIELAMKELSQKSNMEYYKRCILSYIDIYKDEENKEKINKYVDELIELERENGEIISKKYYDYIVYRENYNESKKEKEIIQSISIILITIILVLIVILSKFLFYPYILKYINKKKVNSYINNESYLLNYQPIVNPTKKVIVGFEALLRLRIDDKLIMPNIIINQIEKCDMMEEVSIWILKQIIKDYSKIKKINNSNHKFYLSMNISLKELENINLCKKFIDILEKSQLQKQCICLEITENASGENYEQIKINIQELRSAGFIIAIDDFGVEYSNLSFLEKFDFDIIKLDKYFIDKFSQSIAVQSLVDAIKYIAYKKDISVVVEGVEEEYQKEYIENLNSNKFYIQGYYYSKPLELSKIKDIEI